jgi:NAD(P)-dependent dehydrogenase (short-subunit alcohol dehydrogenase family)
MELPKGKIALVTGGSRGTACALMLVDRGDHCIATTLLAAWHNTRLR